MNALDVMASYLPAAVVRALAEDPSPIAAPKLERSSAAVLFADVSGFSALADRLARLGPVGAEQLSAVLNARMGQLIELIAAAGGEVVDFAGDAIMAAWPAEGGPAAELAAARAAATCASALQAAVRAADAAEVGPMVRIGIDLGELAVLHLGGLRGRWALGVVGDPVRAATAAAALAEPGEAVVGPSAWALLAGTAGGTPLPGGQARLDDPGPAPAMTPVAAVAVTPAMAEGLSAYIPRAILGRLAAGQTGWLAELRPVTVLFVNLPELERGTGVERAQELFLAVQGALYRYEGSVNKLSVDDKGVTLVAALGLPPLAHEDDPSLGLLAACAVDAALDELGAAHSIGAATGRPFCGVVGNERRREYTMIGDVVNLAARLMQAAGGGILCDEASRAATLASGRPGRLEFEVVAPITVKGKAEPVAAYRPRGQLAALAPERPAGTLVGRDAELAVLEGELAAAGGAGPRAVLVEGDAGIGKTRLVAELVARAAAGGVPVLRGGAERVERFTPYYAWRAVFAAVLGTGAPPGGPPTPARRALDGDARLRELAPLLDAVNAVELADNPVTAQLRGEVRADNTRALLLRLLGAAVGEGPALLVLDDAHWLDSASWALALATCEQVDGLLTVIVARPLEGGPDGGHGGPARAARARLLTMPGSRLLALEALSDADAAALVRQHLGVDELPAAVATMVEAKAEGHPLFAEELASALRDAGLVHQDGGRPLVVAGPSDLEALSFPDTVQGVITSRIDRLPPAQELTLKVASVIGRVFTVAPLREVHPLLVDRPTLADHLLALERADLTVPAEQSHSLDSDAGTWLFKHVLTQEVAYGLLLFAQRRRLHRAVAEWYELATPDDLSAHYRLLAHHWARAEDDAKALGYLDLAGEQALHRGAYAEAVRLLADAVATDDRLRVAAGGSTAPVSAPLRAGGSDRQPLRRARRRRLLGEAHIGLGDLEASGTQLRQALAELGRPLGRTRARIAANLTAHVARQAAHRLRPGRRRKPSSEARESLLESASTCAWLNQIYYYGNRPLAAFGTAVKGLNLAEVAGPSPELARLSASVGLSAGIIPLHRSAEAYFGRALAAAEEADDLQALAWVLQLGGLYAIGVGHWDAVDARLGRAQEVGRRLSDRRRLAEIDGLVAWVAYFRGRFADAAGGFATLEAAGRRGGDKQVRDWGLLGQVAACLRAGQLEPAGALLERRRAPALAALRHLLAGDQAAAAASLESVLPWVARRPTKCYAFDLYAASAEVAVALAAGGGREAAELARRCCAGLDGYARVFPIGRPRALLCQGRRRWAAGYRASAAAAWRRALAAAERLGMPYDQALAHAELGRAGGPGAAAHLARAAELSAALGIKEPG